MFLHLRFQAALNQGAGELFEQATFGEKFFGIGAFFEQFINQFASNGHVLFFFLSSSTTFYVTTYTKYFTPSDVGTTSPVAVGVQPMARRLMSGTK